MADATIEAMIRLEWERASQTRLQRGLSSLSDGLKKAFGRDAPTAIDATTDALKRQNTQLQQNAKTLDDYNNEFDKINNQVGLAGDAGSNLAAVGGVVGGEAGSALSAGGGIIELVESLPRLKAALSGLPAAAKAAIDAIGIGNVGAVGAIAVMGFAISKFQEQVAADAAKASGILAALGETAAIAATGTTESIQAQIEAQENAVLQAKANADVQNKFLADLNRQIEQDLNPAQRAILEFNTSIGTGGAELKASREAADAANKALVEQQIKLNGLKNALDDTAVATNDAVLAEEELAKQRTQNTLQAANDAADMLKREQAALDGSVEQNEDRLKAIENEEAVLKEQLAVLTESGDTSEEVTRRIEALNKQLSVLGEEARFIKEDALPAQRGEEDAQKRIDDAKKARAEAAKIAEDADKKGVDNSKKHYEERAKLETEYQNALLDIVKRGADAAEKAVLKLEQDQADALTDARNDRTDAMVASQRDEAKALRDHQRTLLKIQRDAQDQEKNLLFDQDFRAIFELRQKTTNDMLSATDELNNSDQERKIALGQEIEDLRTNLDRRRAELVLNYERESKEREQQIQDELVKEQQKYAEKQRLQQQAIAQELALTQQSEQQKVQIIQNAFASISQLAGSFLSSLSARASAASSSSSTQPRSQPVNTAQAGSQTLKSNVQSSGGGGGVQVTVNETTNPQKTAKLIVDKIQNLFNFRG